MFRKIYTTYIHLKLEQDATVWLLHSKNHASCWKGSKGLEQEWRREEKRMSSEERTNLSLPTVEVRRTTYRHQNVHDVIKTCSSTSEKKLRTSGKCGSWAREKYGGTYGSTYSAAGLWTFRTSQASKCIY